LCVISFKDGLRTLGLLECLIQHPEQFRPLLCAADVPMTADVIRETFQPTFSDDGSNRRQMEARIYMWWLDLLEDIEGNFFG